MNLLKRSKIQNELKDLIDSLNTIYHDNQHYPSEIGAGTDITDTGREEQSEEIIEFIKKTFEVSNLAFSNIFNDLTFEEILQNVNLSNVDNLSDIKEVDDFIEDRGESKYKYIVRVFQYKNEEKYFSITEQRSSDGNTTIDEEKPQITNQTVITKTVWS